MKARLHLDAALWLVPGHPALKALEARCPLLRSPLSPRRHLTSFYGIYAPHAALRPLVTLPPPTTPAAPQLTFASFTSPEKKRKPRLVLRQAQEAPATARLGERQLAAKRRPVLSAKLGLDAFVRQCVAHQRRFPEPPGVVDLRHSLLPPLEQRLEAFDVEEILRASNPAFVRHQVTDRQDVYRLISPTCTGAVGP